jgi:DNA-directed RNA polymerase III subunit RPC2
MDDPSLAAPVKEVKNKWKLLPHFLKVRGLVKQHIDSFNYFLNVDMAKIVAAKANNEITSQADPKFFFRYKKIWVGDPEVEEDSYMSTGVTPHECRLRDRTYSAPIYVNIYYTRGRERVHRDKVPIGKIPIMLRSERCVLTGKSEQDLWKLRECPFDPGGYFVVKGQEKVILIQEQLSKNRVIIELDPKGNYAASITSSTMERKSRTNILIKNKKLYMKHNTLGDDMPIVIVLKAMGIESDQEIVSMVGCEPEMVDAMAASLEEVSAMKIFSQKQALEHIGNKIRAPRKAGAPQRASQYQRAPQTPWDEAREVLSTVVLSHLPVQNYDFRPKAIYVAHILRRVLLAYMGEDKLDDKDYYGNKRLELAGALLSLLFEDLFKRFNADLKRHADTVLDKPARAQAFDIYKMIRQDTITNGFVHALSTGNWSIKRFKMERAGITQVLSRLSYISALGMMTRVNSQFEKTRKVSGPRSLQPSQWGMLCPADTPEGEACGLVKNLALLAHVTSDEEVAPIERTCYDLGVEPITLFNGEAMNHKRTYLVLLNGLLLGVHANPHLFVEQLRRLRRVAMIGEFVSVMIHDVQRAVHIASDGGRVCRPLLLVDPITHRPRLTSQKLQELRQGLRGLNSLIKEGCIEYVACTCTRACTHTCTHACTHTRTHACTRTCTHTCTHACTRTRTHACTRTCTHTRTHMQSSPTFVGTSTSTKRMTAWLHCRRLGRRGSKRAIR